ncbi:oxidoreductase [Lacimicrobium alkaliphilum]|uniref:Oxidoreductase n=1 Tax=Lacimicrobium alkaliphilum TaxID=1526571 RepID=A0A0U3B174_9ALTE|nr:oxidoreductase [Lacimicrobium alkaliphilum]ALS98816.1 oxidoreductase [Lacimicrobium alkaliphilum]
MSPSTPPPPVRTAVIGFGLSARVFHLPFIRTSERFELVGISTSQTQQVRQAYPDVGIYNDAKQLLSQSGADLVIITAPNHVHYPLAEQALEKGLHVLIEKPMVIDTGQGHALIELAKQRNLVLAPFHNRRWDSDFLTVQKLIQEQRLGDIKVFESSFNRFRPTPRERWREQDIPGAGILYDLGPHLIDQALCLFGIPQTISATLRKSRPGSQAVDYFHLQLHYADKEILLHSDPYSTGPNPRFRVKGTKGTYIKDGLDPQEQRLRDGMLPDHNDWAAEKPYEYGTLYTETGKQRVTSECGGYQHLYNNLADAIVAEAPLAVSAEQALDGIKIIQQACTMLR